MIAAATSPRGGGGTQRADSWGNVITGLSVTGKDARLSTTYSARAPVDQMTIESMYEQDDIFPLIVDRIPEHGTRKWIRMTGAIDARGRPDKDFGRMCIEGLEAMGGRIAGGARGAIFELWRQHRLYGGAVLIVGADDGQAMDQPLVLERIRSIRYLNVVNRWELNQGERNRDPLSPNFRKPDWYSPTSTEDRIHHSRVIRLPRSMVASDRSMRGSHGWDLPILERVWEPLRQFGSLFGYAEHIFQDLFQGVVTMKGLMEMLAADEGTNAVLQRLQTMALVRSSLNMIVLDEGETYERRNQTPTGLSDIMIRTMDRLAAAAEMPLSILFGQAPTGLSTDDVSGRTSFYDSVRNKQDRLLRGAITYLIEILIASKDGPFKGKAPTTWSFDFAPLLEPDDKQVAERRHMDAETEEKLIANDILTPQEVRSRYLNDPSLPYQLDVSLETTTDFADPVGDQQAAAELGLRPGSEPPSNGEAPGAGPAANGARRPLAPLKGPSNGARTPTA